MGEKKNNASRNVWIDTLRGIAALAVVYHHLLADTKYQGNWFYELARYGRHGIEIFFFISGYCVQAASYRVRGTAEFFWHRFWRIFPPYYLSLAAVLAAGLVHKAFVGPFGSGKFVHSLSDLLAVLGIMTYPATPVAAMNWVNWTLTYELFFYLVIGLSMITRARFAVLLGVSALGFFSRSLHPVPGFFFVDYWCIYALGAAFHEYSSGKKIFGLLLGGLNLAVMAMTHPLLVNVIVVVTLLSVAASAYRPDNPLARPNPLTRVGKISYSLYLLHCPVGIYAWFGAQEKLGLTSFPASLVYFVPVFTLCLLAAYASYRLVEAPSLRIGKAYATYEQKFGRPFSFSKKTV